MAYGETYEQFTEKFKPKLTTDDCYTPTEVYAAVLGWATSELHLEGRPIVRPFYPGGDYEHYPYPEGCVVIDNPPFSIYTRIVRFYLARGIRFLLFAPSLTQAVVDADVCYLATYNDVTYQNGALVCTSFTTNLLPGVRLWTAPGLRADVQRAADRFARTVRTARKNASRKKYRYPDHVITAATVGRISKRGVNLLIPSDQCCYIRRAGGVELFGAGLLLSRSAAAERAAAERAAAEQAAKERADAERAVEEELTPIEIEPYVKN